MDKIAPGDLGMTAEVLRFPEPRKPVPCGQCGKELVPRFPGNRPAYCCYDCGRLAQPDAAAHSLKRGFFDQN